jgi:hypothetical protein
MTAEISSMDQVRRYLDGCLGFLDSNDHPLAAAYLSSCLDAINGSDPDSQEQPDGF